MDGNCQRNNEQLVINWFHGDQVPKEIEAIAIVEDDINNDSEDEIEDEEDESDSENDYDCTDF